MEQFDLAIIGAGPGGYVAAILAAKRGLRVALIEKNKVGGVCLQVGCIPTKTMITCSSLYKKMQKWIKTGIFHGNVSFDFGKIFERKCSVVDQITQSLTQLISSNKITLIYGVAKFIQKDRLKVKGANVEISATNIIIATGSRPMEIGSLRCDHEYVLDSTSILDMKKIPKSLAIVGGGYIGCEFASLFSALGVKIHLIEALDTILPYLGRAAQEGILDRFRKDKIDILTKSKVESIAVNKGVILNLGKTKVEAEKALIAVGRSCSFDELDLQKCALKPVNGFLGVNERLETATRGIYAIGDVTGKSLLAHVASHQGMVAVENICGIDKTIRYNAIPAVVFTDPEIASVGYTQEEAKGIFDSVKTARFPLANLGKAIASDSTEGFSEIVFLKDTHQVVGAQVIGDGASILIAEMALAIEMEATLESLIETVHAHPTLSETWLETALLAYGIPIHSA